MPEWLLFTAVISLIVGVAAYAKGLYTGRDENESRSNTYLTESVMYRSQCEKLVEKNKRLQAYVDTLEDRLKLESLRVGAKHLRGCK